MVSEHFDRLGTLTSTILAANDRINDTGTTSKGTPASRFMHVQRNEVPFRLFAHPGNAHVDVEAVYRPSNVYANEMSHEDIKEYARGASIEADDQLSLQREVVSHRVMTLNNGVEFEEAYEPVLDEESFTDPRVSVLPLTDYPDEPDGFVVRASLFPADPTYGLASYNETVSQVIEMRVDLSRDLHTKLGLDELHDDPTEQELEEPSTRDDHLPSFA